MKTAPCEMWLCVSDNGDYGIGVDAQSARDHYEENIGPLSEVDAFRCYQLTLTVPLPNAPVLTATVPDMEQGELALTVAAE